MKKDDFIKKNIGEDKIKGRPIRLNKVKLNLKPGKNYAELLFWGDVHSIASEVIIKQRYNSRNKVIEEVKQYVCLTGSYLSWDKSYAQMKAYPPIKTGSPKAKLFSDNKGVHFSF